MLYELGNIQTYAILIQLHCKHKKPKLSLPKLKILADALRTWSYFIGPSSSGPILYTMMSILVQNISYNMPLKPKYAFYLKLNSDLKYRFLHYDLNY